MRNQALDVLRGVAILLVMAHHFVLCGFAYQIGWSGVDLFFVLSGFLISGLLFDEFKSTGRIDAVRFWIRRGFKIYPPFYLLIFLTVLGMMASRHVDGGKLLSEMFFLQSYLPHIWGHTWSLAVEEHFYFLLPLLLLALPRIFHGRRDPFFALPWLFGFMAMLCGFFRWLEFHNGASAFTVHSQTHLRIDSLFAGVVLCYFARFHRERFERFSTLPLYLAAGVMLLPLAFASMDGSFMNSVGISMLYVGYALLLAWAVGRRSSKNPICIGLSWIGKYSYAIYLWHIPIRQLLYNGHVGPWFFLEGLAISIPAGFIASELLEKPSLALRERFFPRAGITRRRERTEPSLAAATSFDGGLKI